MGELVDATRRPDGFRRRRWVAGSTWAPALVVPLRSTNAPGPMPGCKAATMSTRLMCGPVAHDVLRHRLGLTYEAQGEGISANQVIDELITQVALT